MNYNDLHSEIQSLMSDERNFLANASNQSALIFERMERLNWVGFYMMNKGELVLGPFQGKVACIRIAFSRGVCGTAASKRKTFVVDNVHEFPRHIACDCASESEIVIPLIKNGVFYGVLDIDSPHKSRFSDDDRTGLEKAAEIILSMSDMDLVGKYYCI
ncbi:MAG: GAF domain-containing protein [Candidatus Kapabacteria bacterium]|jgi:L-methionine (R)-S-oxide reductase|nr:GAF domain-containing protein [Candidatus Kapabacteria bacterium]